MPVLFQELLQSRREKLRVTEEIMNEKDGAKQVLDKKIEASLRRQNFVEKKIIEKVMFEKPKKKKEQIFNEAVFQKCDNNNDEQQS